MRDRGVSCLPVVLAGRLVGIVSERDFLELSLRLYEQAIESDG
jgi:CBS domain-containing protein